ncbi:hypothetical protein HELRODRAFT_180896 [Helobdella robusta]|uniref:Transmembrane protein n=1 Tax=Helobdella robusta TaxID=6412 RepID=T1FGD9_HELRO|nr:hypothetical protein HELRODRAFT_180896 [Helobdella robusta]ESN93371.1 hypothetical protein HELRODRAFT_180896 [Helobdella robusta]
MQLRLCNINNSVFNKLNIFQKILVRKIEKTNFNADMKGQKVISVADCDVIFVIVTSSHYGRIMHGFLFGSSRSAPSPLITSFHFQTLICGSLLIIGGVWFYFNEDSLTYSHLVADPSTPLISPPSSSSLPLSPPSSAAASAKVSAAEESSSSSSIYFSVQRVPYILIFVGVVIASISFLGCCGACTESVCFLGFVSLPFISLFNLFFFNI